jgi:hypothetical protein
MTAECGLLLPKKKNCSPWFAPQPILVGCDEGCMVPFSTSPPHEVTQLHQTLVR